MKHGKLIQERSLSVKNKDRKKSKAKEEIKLYCLSGLGVDKRAFLNFTPQNIELIHIKWIEPISSETLEEYANRLYKSIEIGSKYNLIGVSFGGMIAVEFSKIKKPEELFLVSTVTNTQEFSTILKIGINLKLQKIIPSFLLKRSNYITHYFFGIKTSTDKRLLKKILKETNTIFLKWAINSIAEWKNNDEYLWTRIHGTEDRILPVKRNIDYKIIGGGHFMIVTHGKEITKIVEKQIFNRIQT